MRKYHFTEIRYATIVTLREDGDEERLCRLAERCIHAEYRRLRMNPTVHYNSMDRSSFAIHDNFMYVKNYIEARDVRRKQRRTAILSMV
jgi:hypothetical protein